MSRKITFIIVIGLISLGVFWIIGSAKRKNISYDSTDELALANNSLINRFNQIEEKYSPPFGPIKLSNDEGYFLKLLPNGKEIYYYLPSSGQIKSVSISNLTSKDTLVSLIIAQIKPKFKKIIWAKDAKKIIASNDTEMIYYDLNSSFSKKLDSKTNDPVFLTEDKIVYLYFDDTTGEGEIRITNTGFENSKSIFKTRLRWDLGLINSRSLALSNGNSFFILDVETGNFSKILENKKDLSINPSPNGNGFAYSYLDEFGDIKLNYYVLQSKSGVSLENMSSQASACDWSADSLNIYCLENNNLKVININSGLAQNIKNGILEVNVQNMILANFEDYLIFKNSRDQKLYSVYLGK